VDGDFIWNQFCCIFNNKTDRRKHYENLRFVILDNSCIAVTMRLGRILPSHMTNLRLVSEHDLSLVVNRYELIMESNS
jgi:hypothetical protein